MHTYIHTYIHTLINWNGDSEGGVLEWASVRQSWFQIHKPCHGQILYQQNQIPLRVDGLRAGRVLKLKEVVVDDLVTLAAGEVLKQHLRKRSKFGSKFG